MIKRSILLLGLICTHLINLLAQNPGYLGKKMEVGLSFGLLNNPFGVRKSDVGTYPIKSRMIQPDLSMGIQASATLSHKLAAVINYQSGGVMSYDEMEFLPGNLINRSENEFVKIWGRNRTSNTNIGLRFYSNRKGSVAPVGAFVSLSAGSASIQLKELEHRSYQVPYFYDDEASQELTSTLQIDLNDYDYKRNVLRYLGFGAGNAMVVHNDRLKLEYELVFNLPFPNFNDNRKTRYYENVDDYYPDQYSNKDQVYTDIGYHNIIVLRKMLYTQIRLGITYLL